MPMFLNTLVVTWSLIIDFTVEFIQAPASERCTNVYVRAYFMRYLPGLKISLAIFHMFDDHVITHVFSAKQLAYFIISGIFKRLRWKIRYRHMASSQRFFGLFLIQWRSKS